jgi:hypothetical protein
MWVNSAPRHPTDQRVPSLHLAHFADATEAEIATNEQFFDRVEQIFGRKAATTLDDAILIFADFLFETRKISRRESGTISQISSLDISIKNLLIHTALQEWPAQHSHQCPCSGCDDEILPGEMDNHLQTQHSIIWRNGLFYTVLHTQVASLLGIGLEITKEHRWRFPFDQCDRTFERFSMIDLHIFQDHTTSEKSIYHNLGGFLASMLSFFNRKGTWPRVYELFFGTTGNVKFTTTPLDRWQAEGVWRENTRHRTKAELGRTRMLPGSPMEDLLHQFRRRCGADEWDSTSPDELTRQPESSDDSDIGLGREMEDEDRARELPERELESEVEIDFEDGSIEQPEERHAEDRDIETETDIERRMEEEANEFEPRPGVHEKVLRRMNQLATLLKKEEFQVEDTETGTARLEKLESLLHEFAADEISPDQFAEVSLASPVLLLLAQHRSFKICRKELFCPEENFRLRKKIKTIGKLATHLVLEHGVAQEETIDMVRYFISKMLPGPIKALITTRTGHIVNHRFNFGRCHYPGCSYVNAESGRIDAHVRKAHKSMGIDVKSLGWFWGIIHAMVRTDPRITIAEALGEGHFWECRTNGCHLVFQTDRALKRHFTQIHTMNTQEGWEAPMRCLKLKWVEDIEDTNEERQEGSESGEGRRERRGAGQIRMEHETQDGSEMPPPPENPDLPAVPVEIHDTDQHHTDDQTVAEADHGERRRVRQVNEAARFRADHGLRLDPAIGIQREAEAARLEEMSAKKREYIRKKGTTSTKCKQGSEYSTVELCANETSNRRFE